MSLSRQRRCRSVASLSGDTDRARLRSERSPFAVSSTMDIVSAPPGSAVRAWAARPDGVTSHGRPGPINGRARRRERAVPQLPQVPSRLPVMILRRAATRGNRMASYCCPGSDYRFRVRERLPVNGRAAVGNEATSRYCPGFVLTRRGRRSQAGRS